MKVTIQSQLSTVPGHILTITIPGFANSFSIWNRYLVILLLSFMGVTDSKTEREKGFGYFAPKTITKPVGKNENIQLLFYFIFVFPPMQNSKASQGRRLMNEVVASA